MSWVLYHLGEDYGWKEQYIRLNYLHYDATLEEPHKDLGLFYIA